MNTISAFILLIGLAASVVNIFIGTRLSKRGAKLEGALLGMVSPVICMLAVLATGQFQSGQPPSNRDLLGTLITTAELRTEVAIAFGLVAAGMALAIWRAWRSDKIN
jgi:hypothetical protein